MASLQETVDRELGKYRQLMPELELVAEEINIAVTKRLNAKWKDQRRTPSPVVYCRVKPISSVHRRIEERSSHLDKFPDLVGCRIVVLHSREVDVATDALRGIIELGTPQEISFLESNGRASGYSGCYWDSLSIAALHDVIAQPNALQNVGHLQWELQVHTAMQEAWSRLSHERFYKSRVGVPHRTSQLLRRLAAVTDLLDEQFVHVEEHLHSETRRIRGLVQGRSGYEDVDLDEYVLLLSGQTWDRSFEAVREVGREAGFRRSEWTELVRIGDETDLAVSVCESTGLRTLGEFLNYAKSLYGAASRARTVDRLADVLASVREEVAFMSTSTPLYDRPLMVVSIARLLEFPDQIDTAWPLLPSIKAGLRACVPNRRA